MSIPRVGRFDWEKHQTNSKPAGDWESTSELAQDALENAILGEADFSAEKRDPNPRVTQLTRKVIFKILAQNISKDRI